MEKWKTVGRILYLGKYRDGVFREWNKEHGKGNWRIVWKVNKTLVDFLGVCALYEDAYFKFLQNNPKILKQLISEASNVYDDELSNIESGFDYTKQETKRTHIQDIAIRRSLIRLGLWFKGKELIRIRQEKGTHPLSIKLYLQVESRSTGKTLLKNPSLKSGGIQEPLKVFINQIGLSK